MSAHAIRARLPLACALVLALTGAAAAAEIPALAIPEDPRDRAAVNAFIGRAATPKPIHSFEVPRHPFMAPNDDSNIHVDAYQTDAHTRAGPLGRDIQSASTFQVADCASVAFDRDGDIVTICVGIEGPRLMLFDPATLAAKAELSLPPRQPGGTGNSIFNDFAGGGYFYLDHQFRAVLPTNTRQIWVVAIEDTPAGEAFALERVYDLNGIVLPGDGIVSALPDWNGRIWFVSVRGVVGTIDPESGAVASLVLDGEIIANSFAVDETGGVFIVSDHALYRFDAAENGEPKVTWRQPYDRGSRVKPGQVTQGSGTTPTLIESDYVAITDNADPRMNVIVYRRGPGADGDRFVCSEPVFEADQSATDNSLVAVGRSLIVENNYGYSGPTATMDGNTTSPGIARVDFSPGGECRTVWTSDEVSPTLVPKASLASGLVYVYTKPARNDGIDAWYLTALDFRTGHTVYSALAGTGLGYNNNYAPVTIGPDGSAYVGALGGLVRFADH